MLPLKLVWNDLGLVKPFARFLSEKTTQLQIGEDKGNEAPWSLLVFIAPLRGLERAASTVPYARLGNQRERSGLAIHYR